MTTFKGAQTAPTPPTTDFAALLQTRPSLIRYQMYVPEHTCREIPYWVMEVSRQLHYFNTLSIPETTRVILDIHTPPGGMIGNKAAFLTGDCIDGLNALTTMWKFIAESNFTHKNLGFGILNEIAHPDAMKTNAVMAACVKAIRSVDKEKVICVTCPYSDPTKFKYIKTFNDRHIWYEFHMYLPFKFTHQGIYDHPVGVKYPDKSFNKERLKRYMQQARDIQLSKSIRIYVGEFSASIFADADSRYYYLRDLIDIFKEWNWNWTYHAWREAEVWSAEKDERILELLTQAWAQ